MDAINKIKELGLDKVSEKTFINENDLEALLDQNFERFHKTKALGFIQILEREYGLGLGDLREACLKYYESHKSEEEPQLFNEYVKPEPPKWKKQLPFIILGIVIAVLMLYLLLSRSGGNSEMITEPAQNTTILKEATQSLIRLKEENRTVPVPIAAETNRSEKNQTLRAVSDNATEIPENDIDLDKAVATLFKEQNLSTEKNSTDTNTTSAIQETNGSESTETNQSNSTVSKSKPVKKEILPSQTKDSSAKEHPSALYIEPINRAWIGILYLDTYKKRSYLIRKPLRLNPKRDMLIISGHPYIKLFYHGKRIPIRSKRKVRFLYKDGKIREIDTQTYNSYSRGITW